MNYDNCELDSVRVKGGGALQCIICTSNTVIRYTIQNSRMHHMRCNDWSTLLGQMEE